MIVEQSILKTIKKLLGPDSDYNVFDQDILVFINSAIATLTQVGVGPSEGFRITGETETWDDFIGDDERIDFVKDYVFMKVKLMFDPPTSSSVLSAYQELCKELEWRLNVSTDPGTYT